MNYFVIVNAGICVKFPVECAFWSVFLMVFGSGRISGSKLSCSSSSSIIEMSRSEGRCDRRQPEKGKNALIQFLSPCRLSHPVKFQMNVIIVPKTIKFNYDSINSAYLLHFAVGWFSTAILCPLMK